MSLESGFYYGNNHPAGEAEDVFLTPEEELSLRVEQQANYQGDWTMLLKERISSPKNKKKFLDMKERFPTDEKRNSSETLAKLEKFDDVPVDVFEHSKTNYDDNIDFVFNSTKYNLAEENNKLPNNLGVSKGYGNTGTVFKDASWQGIRLDNRQKNIIEAHEKLHGIFMGLSNGEKAYILSPFDLQKLNQKDKAKADEVLARMSQLKNYFGFRSDEVFTKEHLIYAYKNYVQDVKIDNNVINLISAIVDIDLFIEVINTVAC